MSRVRRVLSSSPRSSNALRRGRSRWPAPVTGARALVETSGAAGERSSGWERGSRAAGALGEVIARQRNARPTLGIMVRLTCRADPAPAIAAQKRQKNRDVHRHRDTGVQRAVDGDPVCGGKSSRPDQTPSNRTGPHAVETARVRAPEGRLGVRALRSAIPRAGGSRPPTLQSRRAGWRRAWRGCARCAR